MGFRFEVQYKVGRENRVADALSRKGEVKELNSLSLLQIQNWDEWERELQQDPKLTSILDLLIS